jgi:hypothetical protein
MSITYVLLEQHNLSRFKYTLESRDFLKYTDICPNPDIQYFNKNILYVPSLLAAI